MERFSWGEVKEYWLIRSATWSHIDYHHDPDGFVNVCMAGEPIRVNQHIAFCQRRAYSKLFELIPTSPRGSKALDVGCGAGRWCRFLAEQGYETTGIDLQPDLLESNRRRYPHIAFSCTPIQDYHQPHKFDLISSVTVLQHIPFEQQDIAIKGIGEMLKPDGYAIMLESIRDQSPHVFSNSIAEWKDKFEHAGLSTVAIRRYDYSFFLRLYWSGILTLRFLRKRHEKPPVATPKSLMHHYRNKHAELGASSLLQRTGNVAKRLAVEFDSRLEPLAFRANLPLPTLHCGFLLKRA